MSESESDYGVGLVQQREPKLLAYDIECTGLLGYSYGMWETNIHKVIEQPVLLSFSYAWYVVGKKPRIVCRTLADTATYKLEPKNDKLLTLELYELFKSTDVTIGHNSKQFDDKMANMFFLKHGLRPVLPHQQLDTKLMAKQIARFPSNSLNNLSDFFGIGAKTATTHADLWWDSLCGGVAGKKAMKKMATYNNQDVKLTLEIFEILYPWYRSSVSLIRIANIEFACDACFSTDYHGEGTRPSKTGRYQRYQCNDCGHWFSDRTAMKLKDGDIRPAVVGI